MIVCRRSVHQKYTTLGTRSVVPVHRASCSVSSPKRWPNARSTRSGVAASSRHMAGRQRTAWLGRAGAMQFAGERRRRDAPNQTDTWIAINYNSQENMQATCTSIIKDYVQTWQTVYLRLIRSYERNCKGVCRNDVLKCHKTFDSVCPNKGQEFRLHQTADITLHLIKIYPDVTSHIKLQHTTTLMYCIMDVFQTSLNITRAATNRMRFLVVREEMWCRVVW